MKTSRRVIGLTGGIASGKSTVLELFHRWGIPVLSADALARECVLPGKPAYRAALRHFGLDFRQPDGSLDRKKLGQLVFKNTDARRHLQNIIHPCVIRGIKTFIRRHAGLMAVDIPLLYEAKLEHLVDEVLVVYATQTQQLARLKARNGLLRAEALQRLHAQWPLQKKCRRADYVLNNTGSPKQLKQAVKKYLHTRETR